MPQLESPPTCSACRERRVRCTTPGACRQVDEAEPEDDFGLFYGLAWALALVAAGFAFAALGWTLWGYFRPFA